MALELVVSFLLLAHAVGYSRAVQCNCGYVVSMNTPAVPPAIPPLTLQDDVFTDALETDFLHVYTLPNYSSSTVARINTFGWQAQAYNVTPSNARGPFGKAAETGNINVNPLRSMWDWGGQGLNGGDPGLQLLVRSADNLLDIGTSSNPLLAVRTSEFAMLRQDMLYGSFRIGMKMSSVSGTCAAFFWYRNNTSELDLEYLSRPINAINASSPASINLVMQTQLSANYGFDASKTPYYHVQPLSFLPSAGYHEYRIDWLPNLVSFYVDGVLLWSIDDTEYIPDQPGHLIVNHWSNGDPKWSGGPPEEDAEIVISYVKAYFNSSDPVRQATYAQNCKIPGASSCRINDPDWTQGIDPTGGSGNVTGRTPFLTNHTGWTATDSDPTHAGTKGGAAGLNVERSMLRVAAMAQCLVTFYWLL